MGPPTFHRRNPRFYAGPPERRQPNASMWIGGRPRPWPDLSVGVRVNSLSEPPREVDDRGLRMAGAMDLERPLGVLDLANETARLLIQRCRLRKVECLWTHPPHAQRRRHPAVTVLAAIVCGWG